MTTFAPDTRLIDLDFLGRPRVIATVAIDTPDGVVLVDPGPATSVGTLRRELAGAGIGLTDVRALLLTHIHLDHAGASGLLVREHPGLRVFVHERGAPHVIDPAKLVGSASRLYGDEMARLWGEIVPVPAASVTPLRGGEVLAFGTRLFDVADTPGHASHHVCYLDRGSGVAYLGDTGGVRVGGNRCVVPPTPPPDIDLDAWRASIGRIRAWAPAQVTVTHFGPSADVAFHLDDLTDRLARYGGIAQDLVARDLDEAARQAAFAAALWDDIRAVVGDEAARGYRAAVPFEHCWMGLARYWRRQ